MGVRRRRDARRAWTAHDGCCAPRSTTIDGQVFKHTGDGVCAAFHIAASGGRSRGSGAAGAGSCRFGWASRPARPNCADADYFGAVLNRAARVMARGHGGQILLDGSTAALLSGVDLVDLGPRRLRDLAEAGRDVSGAERRACGRSFRRCGRSIHAREICGLRPRASSDARPNSPRSQAAMQGASAGDVDRCGRGRQDPAGGGGRGTAGRRIPRRGVVIELAPVGDPAAVPEAVAAVLGITQQPGLTLSRAASPPHWKAGHGCWCSTTANTCWTRRPI